MWVYIGVLVVIDLWRWHWIECRQWIFAWIMFYKIKQANQMLMWFTWKLHDAKNKAPIFILLKRNKTEIRKMYLDMERIKFLICHKLCYIMLLKKTQSTAFLWLKDLAKSIFSLSQSLWFFLYSIRIYGVGNIAGECVCVYEETSDANHRFNLMNSLRLNSPYF